jgi:CRISPR system Cascade subunit CasD
VIKVKTILMKFAGPMQSWGTNSHFESRYTDFYPSKSAIIGLIAASLGYRRHEDEKIQKLNKIEFALRVDQQGKLLRDYQIAAKYKNGAFDKNYVTNRYYLEDAVFVVAISGEDEIMKEIYRGLKNPYFQQFMGRRSVPVNFDFLISINDDNIISAIEKLPWQAQDWYKKENKNKEFLYLDVYADGNLIDEKVKFRRDKVLSFSQKHRKFTFRPEGRTKVRVNNDKFADTNDEHDIFEVLGG